MNPGIPVNSPIQGGCKASKSTERPVSQKLHVHDFEFAYRKDAPIIKPISRRSLSGTKAAYS